MNLRIIGKIELPAPSVHTRTLVCDDCGCYVDSSFGDPREIITTTYHDGTTSVRRICDVCSREWENELDDEPKSIFG